MIHTVTKLAEHQMRFASVCRSASGQERSAQEAGRGWVACSLNARMSATMDFRNAWWLNGMGGCCASLWRRPGHVPVDTGTASVPAGLIRRP
jgi:hypothetical protein